LRLWFNTLSFQYDIVYVIRHIVSLIHFLWHTLLFYLKENTWIPSRGSSRSVPPFNITAKDTGSTMSDVTQGVIGLSDQVTYSSLKLEWISMESACVRMSQADVTSCGNVIFSSLVFWGFFFLPKSFPYVQTSYFTGELWPNAWAYELWGGSDLCQITLFVH
jgi:hypothetical protein